MSDQDILARTIWGEFRSGGYNGMQAVANVIVNRFKKKTWYGHTISEVCLREAHGVFQFDCNDPMDPNFDLCQNVTPHDHEFSEAQEIAAHAVAGTLPDITRGALNYFSKTITTPGWAKGKIPTLELGNTAFYNNID